MYKAFLFLLEQWEPAGRSSEF